MTCDELKQWALSHQTDIRISKVIAYIAQCEWDEMQRIWEDPTHEEFIAIHNYSTDYGVRDNRTMRWGIESLATVAESFR